MTAAAEEATTYGDFVSGLFQQRAVISGKPLVGDKTPFYIRYIPFLHRLFREVRFVHIIRDGRDVALSVLEWAHPGRGPGRYPLWDDEPVAVCALWWQWTIQEARAGAKDITGRYAEVRYEALSSQPREVLKSVLSFLDLPFAEDPLEFHRGRTRHEPGLRSKDAWLPPTPGLRDWRTQMPPRDAELFEALAGATLQELGYERASKHISPQVAAVAERCRSWWETDRVKRPRERRAGPGSLDTDRTAIGGGTKTA